MPDCPVVDGKFPVDVGGGGDDSLRSKAFGQLFREPVRTADMAGEDRDHEASLFINADARGVPLFASDMRSDRAHGNSAGTDINGKFSVDDWAVRHGLTIANMTRAKEISAAILEQDIGLRSMLPLGSTLPSGLILKEEGPFGIFIGWEKYEPFEKTLRLIPRNVHLGIGCRKGTAAETIGKAVRSVLERYNIDHRALQCAASIDLKAGEPGLLEFCRGEDLPLSCYSAEELLAVPGEFAHSDFVESITGVDNVCERAAMMHADRLIIPKTVCDGVTVAAAVEMEEVSFE